MEPTGRYHDGKVARSRLAVFAINERELILADATSDEGIDRWPLDTLFEVDAPENQLWLGSTDRPYGARFRIAGFQLVKAARERLPDLVKVRAAGKRRERRLLVGATAGLLAVIGAYIFGVPLLADRLVWLVPPAAEEALGQTAGAQIETMLTGGPDFRVCDPDPQSVANRAIARFASAAMEGSGSPFNPHIDVVRSDIPNAFALPGGQAYYFSELLKRTESPAEFAGVMAHEFGHVVHRHGMQTLISTSATGLLVGFVLGDLTGLSVAGGLGAALIDTRFSREAERQADGYAVSVAQRLGYDPTALGNLLERIAADDDTSSLLALFSTHPLTAERRAMLDALQKPGDTHPAFSAEEWQAIRHMCDRRPLPGLPGGLLDGAT